MNAKISERAIASAQMPKAEQAISELYRMAGEKHADLEAAAKLKEELKTTFLQKWKQEVVIEHGGKLPDSHAERIVKAQDRWEQYIRDMCSLRAEADKAFVQMTYYKIKHWERQSLEASQRAEMRMAR